MTEFTELKEYLERFKKWPESRDFGRLLLLKGFEDVLRLADMVENLVKIIANQPPPIIPAPVEPEEPLIRVREFCNSLIVDGKMIIFPHNLTGYINDDPTYFQDCYYQKGKGSPVWIRRNKMLAKLRDYKDASRVLKKYFYEEGKNGQENQEDRKGSQEDRKGLEGTGEARQET